MGATPPGTPPPTGRPRIKVIGTDIGAFEREEWVESIVLSPAERYIVHVRFDEPGDYALVNRVQGIDHLGGVFFPETDRLGTVRVVAGTQTFGAPTPARAAFDTLRTNLAAARARSRSTASTSTTRSITSSPSPWRRPASPTSSSG